MTMTTHYSLHRQDDYVLDLDDGLVLRSQAGNVELMRGQALLVSVATDVGEALGDEPALATGLFLRSVEVADGVSTPELALALYATLQAARIDERTSVLSAPDMTEAVRTCVGLTELNSHDLLGARVDVALRDLARCFEGHLAVPVQLYLHEIEATINSHVRRCFEDPGSFFYAVGNGELSEAQYVYMSSQQHAYVRYTTRVLGYCVAYSEDAGMRQHFARHLAEEVNHEKIIEADLRYLGVDVDYVVNDLEPAGAAAQFTLGELALISHFHDPITLMAAPLVAEGMTAHLDQSFITSLNQIVAGWGYKEPARASMFISSHIDFDSGDDGHFEGAMRALAPHITDERSLRKFVSALHAQADSFLRIYTEGMTEAAVFA